jgi:cbb3-type cytochrome oxidase maturation protein
MRLPIAAASRSYRNETLTPQQVWTLEVSMYFPYFMAYMVVGLVVSLMVFLWALRSGQFRDQQRARFLPLDEEPDLAPSKTSRVRRVEACALMVLALAGLVASGTVLLFSLLRVR